MRESCIISKRKYPGSKYHKYEFAFTIVSTILGRSSGIIFTRFGETMGYCDVIIQNMYFLYADF